MFTVFGFYKFKKINDLKKNQKILSNLLNNKNIKDLNDFISKDKRIEKVMVPFGDGMTVCRKI